MIGNPVSLYPLYTDRRSGVCYSAYRTRGEKYLFGQPFKAGYGIANLR